MTVVYTGGVIARVLRTANSFAEAAALDRADVAAMSFEQRISEVERLRRVWFGEDRVESRLDRVLASADPADVALLAAHTVPPVRRRTRARAKAIVRRRK